MIMRYLLTALVISLFALPASAQDLVVMQADIAAAKKDIADIKRSILELTAMCEKCMAQPKAKATGECPILHTSACPCGCVQGGLCTCGMKASYEWTPNAEASHFRNLWRGRKHVGVFCTDSGAYWTWDSAWVRASVPTGVVAPAVTYYAPMQYQPMFQSPAFRNGFLRGGAGACGPGGCR
jgi:hypothetical protein